MRLYHRTTLIPRKLQIGLAPIRQAQETELRAPMKSQSGGVSTVAWSGVAINSAPRLLHLPFARRPRARLMYVLLTVLTLFVIDGLRPAPLQLSAMAYVWLVHEYQVYVSPTLSRRIHCRFIPSCSAYSSEAVRRYGIIRGGALTAKRLIRCNPWQQSDTVDPVP